MHEFLVKLIFYLSLGWPRSERCLATLRLYPQLFECHWSHFSVDFSCCKATHDLNWMFYQYSVVMSSAALYLVQTGLEHFAWKSLSITFRRCLPVCRIKDPPQANFRILKFWVNKHRSWGKSIFPSYWCTVSDFRSHCQQALSLSSLGHEYKYSPTQRGIKNYSCLLRWLVSPLQDVFNWAQIQLPYHKLKWLHIKGHAKHCPNVRELLSSWVELSMLSKGRTNTIW